MKYYLHSNDANSLPVFIYLFEKYPDKFGSGDIISNKMINVLNFDDWENSSDITFAGVGPCDWTEIIDDTDTRVRVKVDYCLKGFGDKQFFLHYYDYKIPNFIRQMVIEGDINTKFIQSLMEKSRKHVEDKIKSLMVNKPHAIKKYIYDAKDEYWNLMNSTIIRTFDSLFLKGDSKEKLFDYVQSFFKKKTKEEYEKYNMPYKCNILLYGLPGTGKTSTILTVASNLKMNIGLIPISLKLDDKGLIHAINSVKKNDCKIIVIEDIDCLFTERKKEDTHKNMLTLSGLLNCMDGLFRNEGILVFLTANNISFIDDAMLRSNRIDYKLYYDYADKDQVKKCMNFYFPERDDLFTKLWRHIDCKNVTISMLQAFLFRHRHTADICAHFNDLDDIINGIKEEEKDSVRGLYM